MTESFCIFYVKSFKFYSHDERLRKIITNNEHLEEKKKQKTEQKKRILNQCDNIEEF